MMGTVVVPTIEHIRLDRKRMRSSQIEVGFDSEKNTQERL